MMPLSDRILQVITFAAFALVGAIYGAGLERNRASLHDDIAARAAKAPMPADAFEPDDAPLLPPEAFRGDITVKVRFVTDVSGLCGEGAYACAAQDAIVMPNPCVPDAYARFVWHADRAEVTLSEWYRAVLCHEIGHMHGWGHWLAPAEQIAAAQDLMCEHICRGALSARDAPGYFRLDNGTNRAAFEALRQSGRIALSDTFDQPFWFANNCMRRS